MPKNIDTVLLALVGVTPLPVFQELLLSVLKEPARMYKISGLPSAGHAPFLFYYSSASHVRFYPMLALF